MVKRLKRKFIYINMALVGIVVIIMFFLICFFSFQAEKKDTFAHLDNAISRFEGKDAPFAPSEPDQITPTPQPDAGLDLPFIYSFVVHTSLDGTILEVYQGEGDVEDAMVTSAVEYVLNSGDNGIARELGLIYSRRTRHNGHYIAFTSTVPLIESMNNTIMICISLSLVTFLILLIVSERLAHLAISPVDKAWQGQKQFIEDASHDLKTPLTVILANNDILLSHRNNTIEEERKWIESTREETVKMKTLIEKMLDLAKSEVVTQEPELKRESISELLESIVLELDPVAFEKNITINAYITKDVFLTTHKETYSKIIQSLIENAIKYSPENANVDVRLKEESKRVTISVTNTGDTIPEKDLEHIFERFYRIDKSRHTEGYGLGLAIAKNLAGSISAELTVSSSDKEGTTFTLISKKGKG
ncbi:MAG: HAMP domain-containing histidine kinase [Clostridia bacterium]|nr:HAMP domain-containing histidine kinase [Clostridia bacterium]